MRGVVQPLHEQAAPDAGRGQIGQRNGLILGLEKCVIQPRERAAEHRWNYEDGTLGPNGQIEDLHDLAPIEPRLGPLDLFPICSILRTCSKTATAFPSWSARASRKGWRLFGACAGR